MVVLLNCFLIVEVMEDYSLRLIHIAHSFEEMQRRLDDFSREGKRDGIRGFY